MSKRKKITLAVIAVFAVLLAGGVFFYVHFFMKAGQTIETLQKLTEGNGYKLTADCSVTFEPSESVKPVTDLIQELLKTDELTATISATGESAQKNLKLQLNEAMTDAKTPFTTVYLVDGKCYFGIDSIVSALAGDEIDKSLFLKVAYNGWIKDHCVTLDQLTNLLYDLTGVTVENNFEMPSGIDALMFLIEPDHLFDPKLWSAVKVTNAKDGHSEFAIDADYFAELVNIQPDQIEANLSFLVDKDDNYTFDLNVTVRDSDQNAIRVQMNVTANQLEQQNTIEAPQLLLTDEQIDQLKSLAEPFIDNITSKK